MSNNAPYTNRHLAGMPLVPIPPGVIPLPVRLPCSDQQPAPHDAQRMFEAMGIALGTHGFTAMRITLERGITTRQLVMTMLAYRSQRDTSLTVTIEHMQRYGLLTIARWTIIDGRGLRRESKPLGFDWDASTTSVSLAQRVARELAAYEARACMVTPLIHPKHAA